MKFEEPLRSNDMYFTARPSQIAAANQAGYANGSTPAKPSLDENLKASGRFILASDGTRVCEVLGGDDSLLAEEYKRRIVACVRALRGVPLESLEAILAGMEQDIITRICEQHYRMADQLSAVQSELNAIIADASHHQHEAPVNSGSALGQILERAKKASSLIESRPVTSPN
jgi:hypothetical protein